MSPQEQNFEALRNLLLRPEQDHLEDLESRLLNPDRLADHVSRALPMAVRQSHQENTLLARALAPLIEDAFKKSIRRNPKLVAEILFPVIGRAVRKAVAETWQRMLQQINEVLETRLSPQSLKWRWQAWRTSRPYIEVVLANTLVFRVEEVFLIHRETGLLLHHVGAGNALTETEVVSSMFTAIQDFVKDSFQVDEDSSLASLQLDDLTVWVEPGPHAYLAAVIRGHPPADLRPLLQSVLEEIHFDFNSDMEAFSGDTAPFEPVHDQLQGCMISQLQEKQQKKTNKIGGLVCAVLLLLVGWFGWWRYSIAQDIDTIRSTLAAAPGYHVDTIRHADGRYHVHGLRDPMAAKPATLLPPDSFRREIRWELKPFLSLEEAFILPRVQRVLRPPPGIEMTMEGGVLYLRGETTRSWLAGTETRLGAIPGLLAWDTSGLRDAEPAVDLKTHQRERYQALNAELERWVIYFGLNETELTPELVPQAQKIAADIQELLALADVLDIGVTVTVTGYSDSVGKEDYNLKISSQRARSVADFFIVAGIDPSRLRTEGRGSRGAGGSGDTTRMRRVNLTIQTNTNP